MNPDSEHSCSTGAITPTYRCMTKGVRGPSEQFEYGLSWVTSRRAALKVFPERLECSDWCIPFCEILEATLFETKQWFIPCYILKIRTSDNTYQFGLSGNNFWKEDLPFDVERLKGRLKYSPCSSTARVVLVIGLVWYIFFRGK